jgi:hypothetical protein
MKLTKEKLQQIIKEELENLVNEEDAIDYAKRQEGYEDKIYSMLVRKDAHKDPETARKIRTDKEMMDYLTMVLIKAHDPMNKRDPDYKTKASVAVEKAFDNVIKNIESGEYAKKPDPSTIKTGKTLTPADTDVYGKLD